LHAKPSAPGERICAIGQPAGDAAHRQWS
jgi:hypothetical protein